MIRLTRINHSPLVLNSDLIEHIETTPDTVITLTTGQKLMVRETVDEVIEKVIAFRRAICNFLSPCPLAASQRVSRPPGPPRREQDDDPEE